MAATQKPRRMREFLGERGELERGLLCIGNVAHMRGRQPLGRRAQKGSSGWGSSWPRVYLLLADGK